MKSLSQSVLTITQASSRELDRVGFSFRVIHSLHFFRELSELRISARRRGSQLSHVRAENSGGVALASLPLPSCLLPNGVQSAATSNKFKFVALPVTLGAPTLSARSASQAQRPKCTVKKVEEGGEADVFAFFLLHRSDTARVRRILTMTAEIWDVIVVGAGLSGLSAAHLLLKRNTGLKILILEGKGWHTIPFSIV